MPPRAPVPPPEGAAGRVHFLPIERLRTSYAELRVGATRPRRASDPSEGPLRVAASDEDGFFEVLDGFKALTRWRTAGHVLVPAIVEPAREVTEHKRLLLASNVPPRTLTPLDEGRVVVSLKEDGLSSKAVARALGRKLKWVEGRVALATRLSRAAAKKVAHGALGPTVALALATLAAREQDELLPAIELHALRAQEALALVAAYRRTQDPEARAALLADPLETVRPGRARPHFGPIARQLEERLDRARDVLLDLASFELPADGLEPAERRRLEAVHRGVLALLSETARELGVERVAASSPSPVNVEVPHDDERRPAGAGDAGAGGAQDAAPAAAEEGGGLTRAPGGDRVAPPVLWLEGDREARGPLPQARPPCPARGGSVDAASAPGRGREEAGPLPRGDRGARAEGPDRLADPARDPRLRPEDGLPGRADDPRRARPRAEDEPPRSAEEGREAALRDQDR